jgi:hypothetical protein
MTGNPAGTRRGKEGGLLLAGKRSSFGRIGGSAAHQVLLNINDNSTVNGGYFNIRRQ